jgi:DNA polymerase-3 subunit epsilon
VETANGRNDSLCSIGVVRMEYGEPVFEREFLVDPEAPFDWMNILIHGITPDMVADAPCSPPCGRKYARIFRDAWVLAHNAAFDLGIISGTLRRYGLIVPPYATFAPAAWRGGLIEKQEFGNHRLNTLCEGLQIPLEHHHNALCDAKACAYLFETMADKFGPQTIIVEEYRGKPRKKRAAARTESSAAPEL